MKGRLSGVNALVMKLDPFNMSSEPKNKARRERILRAVDEHMAKHRELYDKLAEE